MAQIIITNVTKIAPSQYRVEFTDNFDMSDLFYEVSTDGTNWSSPIGFTSVTSPQTITVADAVNFNVRLSSNYTPPPTPETGFLMINTTDKFLINDTDSLKYTN